MHRVSDKAQKIHEELMGKAPNETRRFNVRKVKDTSVKDTYEKQGHMIQGNVDIQRNVYEK